MSERKGMLLNAIGFFVCLFSLVADCHCEERPSLKARIAAGALVTTAAIDGAQTVSCVRAGTCREANPTYRAVAGSYAGMALVKTGVVVGTLATAANLKRHGHPRVAWAVVLGMTAAQGVTIAWNANQLRQVRR